VVALAGTTFDKGAEVPHIPVMRRLVDFEWDEAKAASNVEKHGVRFAYAVRVFDDPDRIEIDAARAHDGESRRKTLGRIDGRVFTVVHVMRGETCRLISARRANRKEERCYGDG